MARFLGIAAVAVLALSGPANADTKAGYDRWNSGDFFGAIREWRPAAIAGDPTAQYNLARAYQLGRGVPLDLKMAESWFAKAATQGHQPSRDNYGLILFQNGDRTTAMPYIEDSAARGEPRAQYVLGTALFNGDIVKKDWVRAYAMMTRASAAGIGPASASLAQMDRYVPLDQRQRGLTLARTLESAAARPQLADNMIGETLPAARPSIGREELPASDTGAPPMPRPVKVAPPKAVVAPPKAAIAPRPVPAPVTSRPAVTATSGGGWRVQLGAFGTEANARKAWSAIGGRLSGLSPRYVRAGAVVRLQAGPLRDRAAAQRACSASGTSCIAIAP